MKRITALLLCALLCFSCLALSGCDEADLSPDTEPGSDIGYQPPPNPDGPLYEGDEIADSPFVGTFHNIYCALDATAAEDVYEDADPPVLRCLSDGTFTLTIKDRYALGDVTVSGTFTVSGETATFTITSGVRDDFLGGDVTDFTMKLRSADVLRYSGFTIASTAEGDLFERVS